jgi:vitamin B12 transporter
MNQRLRQRLLFAAVAVVRAAIALVVGRSVNAQVPGEVHGRVASRVDGRVVVGARIEEAAGATSAMSDDDGTFTLRGLTPGRHELRISAIGFRPASAVVAVDNGREQTLSIALDALPMPLARVVVRGAVDSTGGTTISRAQIAASGEHDLAELLLQLAGVMVIRSGGPGSSAYLSIHGSNADEVLVLVDGEPINSPLTGQADLSRIPLADIERVTVLPGAQSARYGARALAGVVLIETRRPAGAELSVTATAGSWGERDGTVSAGLDAPNALGGVLTASRNTTVGNFPYDAPAARGGGNAVRQNDNTLLSSISAAVATEGPVIVAIHGAVIEDDRGLPGSITAPDCCAREGDTRAWGSVSAHSDRGPIGWSVDANLDHERTRYQDSEPAIPPAYNDRATATSIRGAAAATIANPVVTLTAGTEAQDVHIATTALSTTAPSSEHHDGLWTHLHLGRPLGHGLKGAIDGGLRVDWSSVISGPVGSPRVGLSLALGHLLASLTGGGSYAPPSLADQYFQAGVLVRPNPELRPERVRDELEARLVARGVRLGAAHITSEIAIYKADVSGMILWFPDYRFVWSPDNYNVRRGGWDARTELVFPRLNLEIRGTLTDVAVDYAGPVLGGQVAYRPRVTGSGAAAVSRGRVRAELAARYIGDRRTVRGSTLNALAPYWIWTVHATVSLLDGAWPIEALIGVDDALDRRAALLIDYPYAGRSLSIGLRLRHASAL